jgi:hypothetical protein
MATGCIDEPRRSVSIIAFGGAATVPPVVPRSPKMEN